MSARQVVSADDVITWLKRHATKKTRDGMARYGIPSDDAFGVTVGDTRAYATEIGRDHALAEALWKSGWYEARLLAAFVDDPAAVTSKQMDAWARDFDSWAICDTVCFHLFDRTPLAWKKAHTWSRARPEFTKRAAFALIWGLAVHDKTAATERFLECLPLVERGASDERHYVRKAVDMALRGIGRRKSTELRAAAIRLARQLIESGDGAQASVGRSALRELRRG